jgi:hypothetical protein
MKKSISALFYIAKTLVKDEEIYPINQINLNKFYNKCCNNLDSIVISSKFINYYNISSLLEIMLHDIELIVEYNKRLSITKIGYYLVSYYIYNVFSKFKRILVPMPFIDVFEFIIRNILNRLLNAFNMELIRMLRLRILFIQQNEINIGQLLQYTDSEYNTDCALDKQKYEGLYGSNFIELWQKPNPDYYIKQRYQKMLYSDACEIMETSDELSLQLQSMVSDTINLARDIIENTEELISETERLMIKEEGKLFHLGLYHHLENQVRRKII